MIIDFKHMEEQILPNFKGGEKAYAVKKFTDDRNMIMHGRLESGASIGLHTHEGNCEMFYIIEGTGKLHTAECLAYADHRVAMALTVAGMASEGVCLDDAGCVAISFPGFFEVMEGCRA